MRLIDADAYAAEMKKRQDACMEAIENDSYDGEQFSPKEHWEGVLAAFAEAKLMLDDMPTIGGWINVKDKLPDDTAKGRLYLVVNNGNVDVGIFHYGLWLLPKNNVNVSHWMPFPDAPKEGEGN